MSPPTTPRVGQHDHWQRNLAFRHHWCRESGRPMASPFAESRRVPFGVTTLSFDSISVNRTTGHVGARRVAHIAVIRPDKRRLFCNIFQCLYCSGQGPSILSLGCIFLKSTRWLEFWPRMELIHAPQAIRQSNLLGIACTIPNRPIGKSHRRSRTAICMGSTC